jgi:hypothetical protein
MGVINRSATSKAASAVHPKNDQANQTRADSVEHADQDFADTTPTSI